MRQPTSYREQRAFFLRFAALYLPWFAFTTAVSASPLAVDGLVRFWFCTVAMWTPVAVFAVAYRRSPGLRDAVLRLDLAVLHQFQIGRLAGIAMLAVFAVGELCAPFALWAGGVDVFIGLTATFVAYLVVSRDVIPRRLAIAWNVFGLTDFGLALIIWFLWSPTAMGIFADGTSSTAQMLQLPLSFIPLAGVPIVSIVHLIAIIQLRRGDARPSLVLHP